MSHRGDLLLVDVGGEARRESALSARLARRLDARLDAVDIEAGDDRVRLRDKALRRRLEVLRALLRAAVGECLRVRFSLQAHCIP